MNVRVALLALGSAILLLSCKGKGDTTDVDAYERLMTDKSDTLMIIESAAGKVKYRFEAPLMERYGLARQPYTEFREGIHIITYNDSTTNVESTITADYALYLQNQDLWEAKGNVVAVNAKGEKLETQQLFWNRKLKIIYSNIDSKITRPTSVTYSQRFESDEEFKNWNVFGVMGWTEFEERERKRKEEQASVGTLSVTTVDADDALPLPVDIGAEDAAPMPEADTVITSAVAEDADTPTGLVEPEPVEGGEVRIAPQNDSIDN